MAGAFEDQQCAKNFGDVYTAFQDIENLRDGSSAIEEGEEERVYGALQRPVIDIRKDDREIRRNHVCRQVALESRALNHALTVTHTVREILPLKPLRLLVHPGGCSGA